ncbi:hypothetical protein G7009_01640 [Pseudomonas capeferrum]|uniref:hypothetical protein n=1 Tax=Pseudomonas capeferrum TaxID=1495066 RepID=UPI0015E316B1|nr:hypothetical protein [Pseudomonas capeferrum]MBA1200505.1 hypothetical protein [Pseudomonas capeferrum]
MGKPIGLSGRCGFALLAVTVMGLPVAVFSGAIGLPVFLSVGALWLVVSAAMIFGHDITEITIWKASIKRDATAAMLAREEVEKIRDQLRRVSAVTVENSYITSGEILLLIKHLMGENNLDVAKNSPGMKRLFSNMNEIWSFVEPDPVKAELLRKKVRQDLGMTDL